MQHNSDAGGDTMNDLIRTSTVELARFLEASLPKISDEFWHKLVLNRLSFQQQRMVNEKGFNSIRQLDFAALLRIADQSWYELSNAFNFPREGRSWLKELQTVRNKWAHLSAETLPPGESYRDADTLGRFFKMLGAEQELLGAIEAAKSKAVAAMSADAMPSLKEASSQFTPGGTEKTVVQSSAESIPVAPMPAFKIGDIVALRSNSDVLMPVIEVIPGDAECRYRVFHNNSKATYYESQLQTPSIQTENRRNLTAGELQSRLTSLHILSPSKANLFSLHSGRIQFIPYQYRPVLKLIRADRPRILIADEVGVGKTIEAGLIIKELKARMDISSVLIICPKALVAERKWFFEMKRFDEQFTAIDGPLLQHCLKETHLDGEWPAQYAKAILPFSLFNSDLLLGGGGHRGKDMGLLSLDPPPKFDLVIVDEAHHIRNSETCLHQGIRYFCDNAQAVLMLTATPVQLGSNDLFTLLNVLRPDLVIDHPSFEQMSEPNGHINNSVYHCRTAGSGWQETARKSLDDAILTEWGSLFIKESPSFQKIYDQLNGGPIENTDRVPLIRAIEELYTFSSFINRTRRRDIGEFTVRKPETLTVEFTSAQKLLHDNLLGLIARILAVCHGQQNVKFMMSTIRRQAASCLFGLAPLLHNILSGKLDRLELMEAGDCDFDIELGFVPQIRNEIQDLLEQTSTLPTQDPKIEAFLKVISDKGKMSNNKALVFSTFRHTLAYMSKNMENTGIRYGLIHGNVPEEERSELRRRFALPREDSVTIDVLLSSEVGCEGLDFQFCDCIVNYDLPWNPMRIEQRIGRIDRYGQKSETVAIVNFITPGTVDADIYERCLWRIGVFHHAVGGSEEILGKITEKLHDIAESFNLTSEERERQLSQLADNGIRQVREEQELESKQSELFGLNVPEHSWKKEVEAAESFWLSPSSLEVCVRSYLNSLFGCESVHLQGEKPSKTLRLNQESRNRMLEDFKKLPFHVDSTAREWEKWLKGNVPNLAVTFEQQVAAEDSKIMHLSVVHPLVRQAARFLEINEPVYVLLETESAKLQPGLHKFAIYRWKLHGISPDESLIAVSQNQELEEVLLDILSLARQKSDIGLPRQNDFDILDTRHHARWSAARADHINENLQLLDHRRQSLTVSHRARCKAIEDQIGRATDVKIRIMKESELSRANADFSRRIEEIRQAAVKAEILASPVVFGTIEIQREA